MSEPLILCIDRRRVSPYALWAYVALKEKQLPFALRSVDLAAGEQREDDYARRTLTGKVPALWHGDFVLAESSAIIEYLEERFPQPTVFPADLRARARMRQVQAWLRSELSALKNERPTTVIFREPIATPLSADGRAAADQLLRVAEALLAEGADHLFGAWCIADTELATTLNRLVANGDAVSDKLARYTRAQWARPAVQDWMLKQP